MVAGGCLPEFSKARYQLHFHWRLLENSKLGNFRHQTTCANLALRSPVLRLSGLIQILLGMDQEIHLQTTCLKIPEKNHKFKPAINLFSAMGRSWCDVVPSVWFREVLGCWGLKINFGAGLDEVRAPSRPPPSGEAHLHDIPNMFKKRKLKFEKLYLANFSAS